ncbi:GAF domain-containing protein [Anaerolineales bacterium HSG24]|nr:GAF domain-containing protein [Anaerolineales bacterium HSG24]
MLHSGLSNNDLDKQNTPHHSRELQSVFQRIVDDVVDRLGCVGAMVAPLEHGNALPVKAYAVSIAPTLLQQLEKRLGITFISPSSVAYLDDEKFQENLSVRAVTGHDGTPDVVVSNRLYDLFRPVVNRPLSDVAQKLTGIKQVIAIPFFLDDQVVGNLFAATREQFSDRDISFLSAYGNQAAIAIQSQRRLSEIQALERVIFVLQSNITNETRVFQAVVNAVVSRLGYAGAMLATFEVEDNSLSVRAYAADITPQIMDKLQQITGSAILGQKTVAYLDDKLYAENMGMRAVKGDYKPDEPYIVSDSLHDLFRPIINHRASRTLQQLTDIKQLIAVPCFWEGRVVGNLFVATREPSFVAQEIEFLTTLAQQVALSIHNARLYKRAEDRRHIAQMFGKMAFSAAAYIHSLRNHVGVSRNYLEMVKMLPRMNEVQKKRLMASGEDIIHHLDQAVQILDHLHEPWREHLDVPTDVNSCLNFSIRKAVPEIGSNVDADTLDTDIGITIHKSLSPDLPLTSTSPDMLTEAFKILIKNAVEAMLEKKGFGNLWLTTQQKQTNIVVSIRDDGTGIKPEYLKRIFEMGWSSKEGKGMGFGLFWTKDYIEGLKGTISVKSVWEEGTTFLIVLPIAE